MTKDDVDQAGVLGSVEELPSMLYWLATYPKSGSTWLRLLVKEYYRGLDHGPAFAADATEYWYWLVSPVPPQRLGFHMRAALRPAAMAHLSASHFGRRVLVKTHHGAYDVAGVSLFGPTFVRKVFVLVRDPRDVLPSFARHMGQGLAEAADTMARNFATLKAEDGHIEHCMGGWSQHFRSWAEQAHVPVTVGSYEGLHRDPHSLLREVLLWLDEPREDLDDERIARAVEACSIESLRAQEQAGGYSPTGPNQDTFFRRGVVGSHKDEVPETLVRRIENDHGGVMRTLGYLTQSKGA